MDRRERWRRGLGSENPRRLTTKARTFPRFRPLSRFPSLGERHHKAAPTRLCFFHGCAPRVSHPFDALLPPRPAGPIPSRSRVWGSPFEALLHGERRARRLHLACTLMRFLQLAQTLLPCALAREIKVTRPVASPGLCSLPAGSHRSWVFHHPTMLLPPWAFPLRGSSNSVPRVDVTRSPSRALLTTSRPYRSTIEEMSTGAPGFC